MSNEIEKQTGNTVTITPPRPKPKPRSTTAKKNMVVEVTDNDIAYLIEEGCRLDKLIKDAEAKFSGVKAELEVLEKGKYKTNRGSMVTISETDQYSEVDPAQAKRALLDKKLGKNFLSCVKIKLTELKRHLSPTELKPLRTVVGTIRKHSFK